MTNERIHPPSEDLFAYRDGELTPEKRAAIEAHVMGCSVCRSLIDQVSSLEAELRQSPDVAPAGYLDHLHEAVRAKVAVAASEGGVEEKKAPPREKVPPRLGTVVGAARDEDEGPRRERGRIKEAPSLPWAAVIGTASAAAAVLVVVVILIRQGPYQKILLPTPKGATVTTAPARQESLVGGERAVGSANVDLNVDLKEREAAKKEVAGTKVAIGAGAATSGTTAPEQVAPKPFANLNPAESPTEEKQDEALKDKLAKRADEIVAQPAPSAAGNQAEADLMDAKTRMQQRAASPRAFADEQLAPGPAYDAILKRYNLPPLWAPRVSTEALANAESELRNLYVSGNAGTDSARVRLYIAEAVRLRYSPGDAPLYDEIVHHYRRVIEMSAPDSEMRRVAEERLRSLER